jgi:Suppressor of fused protein (SUFU)
LNRTFEIQKHYEKSWHATAVMQPFTCGPTHELPSDFSVLKFSPAASRREWIYATSSLSQEGDAKFLELHMRSESEDNSIVELLYAIAHFHRIGKNLDVGHTVNFGRPWIDGSKCDHGLVSLPYVDGPELEVLILRNRAINFYWIVPIYKIEVEFKKSNGLELLEKRFDEVGLSYANPHRAPVV